MELTIGQKVTVARKKLGWSMEKLAREAELSLGTINSAEKNLVEPRLETVIRIAHALGMSIDELVEGHKFFEEGGHVS